jgi:hypothetical protein
MDEADDVQEESKKKVEFKDVSGPCEAFVARRSSLTPRADLRAGCH